MRQTRKCAYLSSTVTCQACWRFATTPATGSVSCGYSASDSSREALQLLLGVGKDPSEQSGGTLTIRAAVTVRARC